MRYSIKDGYDKSAHCSLGQAGDKYCVVVQKWKCLIPQQGSEHGKRLMFQEHLVILGEACQCTLVE